MLKKEKIFQAKDSFNAFLGEGTSFKGVLTFEGTVRIDGTLEGEIYTKDALVIGENAHLKAQIRVGTVTISGTVEGDIVAERKIEILSTGRVFGNLTTPVLGIEEGVIFEGTCSMAGARERVDQGVPRAAGDLETLSKK